MIADTYSGTVADHDLDPARAPGQVFEEGCEIPCLFPLYRFAATGIKGAPDRNRHVLFLQGSNPLQHVVLEDGKYPRGTSAYPCAAPARNRGSNQHQETADTESRRAAIFTRSRGRYRQRQEIQAQTGGC